MSCLLMDLSGRLKPKETADGIIPNAANNTWTRAQMDNLAALAQEGIESHGSSWASSSTAKAIQAETSNIAYEPIDIAQQEAEELIKNGITKMTDHLEGLQKMAAAAVSRQLGASLVDIVTGLVMEQKKKDSRILMLEKQQALGDHELEKQVERNAAEEAFHEHLANVHESFHHNSCGMDALNFRERDSDDSDDDSDDEEDDVDEAIWNMLPPRPVKPADNKPNVPEPARTAYGFFEQEWRRSGEPPENLNAKWQHPSPWEKLPYQRYSDQDRKRREDEMAAYKAYLQKAAEDSKRYESQMAIYEKTVAEVRRKFLKEKVVEPTRGKILREALAQAKDELEALEKVNQSK